jgi:pimeloyl-ACP methyl ester carboxylesterase
MIANITLTMVAQKGQPMPIAALPGDLQMCYEDDAFTDPWSKAESVILHHGNAKNSRLWYAWVPLLARDYRVIRVDARGFGRSSIPAPGYSWSLEGFATDLSHLMDHLKIDKAHLVGETIGGTIALQFAYQFPDRLQTVTTCTSPYKFRGVPSYLEYYNLVKEQGVEAWVRQTANRRIEPGQGDPQHSEWYAQQMSQTAQHVVMETLAYLSTVDLTPILPQISTPALVMVAERSAMNTPDRARSLAELLPNGTLVEVPGTSGYVQHSAPEQCVAIWRDFVNKVGEPG